MAKTKDDSVLFSLQELLKIEQDRVQEEQAAKVRADAEAQRRMDDERARQRSEQEARQRAAEETRRAEEQARLDAEDRRVRERDEAELRIRLEQELRTREAQQERMLAHEREIAQLAVARESGSSRRGGLYAMLAVGVLCSLGLTGYFAVFHPAQQRAELEQLEALRRLETAHAETNRLHALALASAAAPRTPVVPVVASPVVAAPAPAVPAPTVRPTSTRSHTRPANPRPHTPADPFGNELPGLDRL